MLALTEIAFDGAFSQDSTLLELCKMWLWKGFFEDISASGAGHNCLMTFGTGARVS